MPLTVTHWRTRRAWLLFYLLKSIKKKAIADQCGVVKVRKDFERRLVVLIKKLFKRWQKDK